jgi:hypothetical protein
MTSAFGHSSVQEYPMLAALQKDQASLARSGSSEMT